MNQVASDVIVIGGGPAGLAAALTLGRAAKRVLLCDAGPRRNAAAEHMHGFLTREGVAPREFRRIAGEQLRPYAVTTTERRVAHVEAEAQHLRVHFTDGSSVACRRVLVTTGMKDQLPDIRGLHELWGHTIFNCPYCHGWEVRDKAWGLLALKEADLEYALFITGWTNDVTVFTSESIFVGSDLRLRIGSAGVKVETRGVSQVLSGPDKRLTAVVLTDGTTLARDALVVRPPQTQVELIESLGLALDAQGFVVTDEHFRTSMSGVYAAGDLTTPMQSATLAAAAGTRAAYALNHELNCASD